VMCSCHCTITHLKKLIALKIYSNLDNYKELDIICDDEILGKDHTLKYIRVTKWKEKVRILDKEIHQMNLIRFFSIKYQKTK